MMWHNRSIFWLGIGRATSTMARLRLFLRATMTHMKQLLWKDDPKQSRKAQKSEMLGHHRASFGVAAPRQCRTEDNLLRLARNRVSRPKASTKVSRKQEPGIQPNGSLSNPVSLMVVPAFCLLLLRASPSRPSILVPGCLPISTLGLANLPTAPSVGILLPHSLVQRG